MESKKVKKPKSKARKIIEWVITIIFGIVFVFASACNISKLVTKTNDREGHAFGYYSFKVLTDSMEPVYPVDSVIIVHKEEPQKIVEQWNAIKDLKLDKEDERNINLSFVDSYTVKENSGFAEYNKQTDNVKDDNGKPIVMTHQLFNIRINENVEEGNGRYIFFVHGINISEHQSQEGQYQAFSEKELLGVVETNSAFLGGVSGFLSSIWGLFICLLIPALYIVVTSVLDIFKAYHSDEDELVEEGAKASSSGNSIENISEQDYEKLKQEMINEMLNGKDSKGKNE